MVDKTTDKAADKTTSQVQQDASQAQHTAAPAASQPADAVRAGVAAVEAAVGMARDAWTRAAQAGATAAAPYAAPYQKLFDDQFARVSGFEAEVAAMQAKGVEQMLGAVDEAARLTKAGMQWYVTMAAQGRQQAMDAAKRSVSAFTPAA